MQLNMADYMVPSQAPVIFDVPVDTFLTRRRKARRKQRRRRAQGQHQQQTR